MNNEKELGGFFELERISNQRTPLDHDFTYTKSARASLRRIFTARHIEHIYLPYYICNAVLAVVNEFHLSYSFYSIDQNFRIKNLPSCKKNDTLIYVNYFGLNNNYCYSFYFRQSQS